MAPDEIQLEVADLVSWDHDIGKVSKSGGDSIDDGPTRHHIVHDFSGG
jgi:hypothetical protein